MKSMLALVILVACAVPRTEKYDTVFVYRAVDTVDAHWVSLKTLQGGSDSAWKYSERATADFNNDGKPETAVITSDVTLDRRGEPLWEDGHRWRLYFEEGDGRRTYAYDRFVPNGRVDAVVGEPRIPGERRTVSLIERTPSQIAVTEVSYDGPDRVQAWGAHVRSIQTHFTRPPK